MRRSLACALGLIVLALAVPLMAQSELTITGQVVSSAPDRLVIKTDDGREMTLRLVTPTGRFEYVVEETDVVAPSRGDLLDPTAAPTLTLVTCYPFYLVGNAPERFVVRARQVLP